MGSDKLHVSTTIVHRVFSLLKRSSLLYLFISFSHIHGNYWSFYCLQKSESEVAQLCPTVFNPMDCSLPDSSIHGILQSFAFSRVLYIWNHTVSTFSNYFLLMCTLAFSMSFSHCISHFYLVLYNSPLSSFTRVCLFTYWRTSWLLQKLGNFK